MGSPFCQILYHHKGDRHLCGGFGRLPARAGTDEVYREFRTNRRPLNVASVVSRTVEQGTSSVPALAGSRRD